jgi:hypothetical protein
MQDMKSGNITDDVLFYGFSRLSDRQPLTKAEQTQFALNHPNIARPTMMFKTFTLRKWYSIFNDARRDFKAGRKVKAMRNAVAAIALLYALNLGANKTKDLYRSFFSGQKPKEDSLIALDTAMQDLLFSRYQASQFKYRTPTQIFGQSVLPNTLIDDVFESVQKQDTGSITRNIPLIGQETYLANKEDKNSGLQKRPQRPTRPERPKRPTR